MPAVVRVTNEIDPTVQRNLDDIGKSAKTAGGSISALQAEMNKLKLDSLGKRLGIAEQLARDRAQAKLLTNERLAGIRQVEAADAAASRRRAQNDRQALRQLEAEELSSNRLREAARRQASRAIAQADRQALRQLEAEQLSSSRIVEAARRQASRTAAQADRQALRQLEAEELANNRLRESARRQSAQTIAQGDRLALRQLEAEEFSGIRLREAARRQSAQSLAQQAQLDLRQNEAQQLSSNRVVEAARRQALQTSAQADRQALRQLEAEQLSSVRVVAQQRTASAQATSRAQIAAQRAADNAARLATNARLRDGTADIRLRERADLASIRVADRAHKASVDQQTRTRLAAIRTEESAALSAVRVLDREVKARQGQQHQAAMQNIQQQSAAQIAAQKVAQNAAMNALRQQRLQNTPIRGGGGGGGGGGGRFGGLFGLGGSSGEFRGLRSSIESATIAALNFRTILYTLGVGFSIRGVIGEFRQLSDIQQKLTASFGKEKAPGMFDRLVGVSNQTGSGIKDNAFLLQRMRNATKDMYDGAGVGEDALLGYVKRINELGRVSGASANEMSNATLQLSQALNAGRLQGDELRSVMENFPALFDAIAAGMGKTRSELVQATRGTDEFGNVAGQAKKATGELLTVTGPFGQQLQVLAKESKDSAKFIGQNGKVYNVLKNDLTKAAQGVKTFGDNTEEAGRKVITARDILKALGPASDSIVAKLKDIPLTIDQSFSVLQNNLFNLLNEFDRQTGIVGKLSNAIQILANNTQTLVDIFILLGATVLPIAIAGFTRLALTILAGPFGILSATIGVATLALVKYRNEIGLAADGTFTLSNAVITLQDMIFGLAGAINSTDWSQLSQLGDMLSLKPFRSAFVDGFSDARAKVLDDEKVFQDKQLKNLMDYEESREVIQDRMLKSLDNSIQNTKSKALNAVGGFGVSGLPGKELIPGEADPLFGLDTNGPPKQFKRNRTGVDPFQAGAEADAQNRITQFGELGGPAQMQRLMGLKTAVVNAFNEIKQNGVESGKDILDAVVPPGLQEQIADSYGAVPEALSKVTDRISEISNATGTFEAIGVKFDSIVNKIRPALTENLAFLGSAMGQMIGAVEGAIERVLNKVIELIQKIVSALSSIKVAGVSIVSGGVGGLAGLSFGAGPAGGGFDVGGMLDRAASDAAAARQGALGGPQFNLGQRFGQGLDQSIGDQAYVRSAEGAQRLAQAQQDAARAGQAVNQEIQTTGQIAPQAFGNAANAMGQLGQAAQDTGQLMQQFIGSTLGNLENAFVQFAQTGKIDFKSLMNSIIADLARMFFRMVIMQPIMMFFQSFLGGGGGGFSNFGGIGIGGSGGCGPGGCGARGFSMGGLVGDFKGFASGGLTSGPGTSTSDRLLTMTSPGEFIVNAAATKANLPMLDYINEGGTAGRGGGAAVSYAPNIVVNVQGGGSAVAGVQQGQMAGKELDAVLRKSFSEMLVRELRPGGTLNQG